MESALYHWRQFGRAYKMVLVTAVFGGGEHRLFLLCCFATSCCCFVMGLFVSASSSPSACVGELHEMFVSAPLLLLCSFLEELFVCAFPIFASIPFFFFFPFCRAECADLVVCDHGEEEKTA